MRMNTALPFSLVLPVLIVFSIDPDTSLVADNTFKQNLRDIASSEDKLNKFKVSPDVRDLELAQGIKDSLKEAGFDTVDSILKEAPSDISNKLGIDPYVAQIIKDAAKRTIGGIPEKETI
jgi:hypothetical protein